MKFSMIYKIVFLMLILAGVDSKGQDLETFKWKNRILIIKSLESASDSLKVQLNEFKNLNSEFKDRKLVLVTINENDFAVRNFTTSESSKSRQVNERIANDILNPSSSFEVILIGLDGGIKLRQNEILLKKELFSIIDSMPMRKNELKK